MDPSLDSVLTDCPAALQLIYMQVSGTEDSQNTRRSSPFGIETIRKKWVIVKNSTSKARRDKFTETESTMEVIRSEGAGSYCLTGTEFLLGLLKK